MSAIITPLLIGFFSGFHCIAMCGGVCSVLCQRQNHRQTLVTNLGRITTYTLLGALFAGLVQGLSLQLNLGAWGLFLRSMMGVMLILTGLVLIFKDRAKWLVLQKPLPFWPQVSQQMKRLQSSTTLSAVFGKGLLWGLIPCGLLYGMLIVAATTADVWRGAGFMLFFGLGTLLPLLLSQVVIKFLLNSSFGVVLRSISGLFIFILGLWILASPWFAHALIPADNVFFTELSAVLDLCIP
ncbi:sulfite exporter TauE/SafE family protein [Marinicella sp. S1101]|uniref:sulfite exporter TauE/SafE family protein n=1 Tax=Marinicella marina TaxID=2996016 RepID=UPI002260A4A8|nr:sulfite exporter TauE/SafE family protein [Marinicella marina]MCX7553312.1 sulfite exporter TauE/SafE family protein [Marinicella marina]MDJ1139044.1 sulfite exporter TauE/SafE family protein [Marinicella marina]